MATTRDTPANNDEVETGVYSKVPGSFLMVAVASTISAKRSSSKSTGSL
jgi:hypothetical protein